MDELVERQVPKYEGKYLFRRSVEFRNRPNATTPTNSVCENGNMPDQYCPQCGIELSDGPQYCPECGTHVADEQTNTETSTEDDSWDWSEPRGPFESPRSAIGSVNAIGFVSFLVAIGLNAVGLPITALPHPVPIALFIFWFGVLVVGLPLWGLLHVTDNVLGFLKPR
jgi:hypothetical protein